MQWQSFHIGTSGWSYRHWSGVFYPEALKSGMYLEYYADRFNCVELNASFYHLPLPTTVAGWVKRTRDTFRFCPKMNRFITHRQQLKNAEESLHRFFHVFGEMKIRLGPVLIQLPPGLAYDRYLIRDFLGILKANYGDYRYALEVRNRSWISDDFLNLITQMGMAFVIADSGGRFPCYEAITADFIYLRFHGRDNLYASEYGDPELREYAGKITGWLHDGREVWVFFNNDFHGYAINNARRLAEMIIPDK